MSRSDLLAITPMVPADLDEIMLIERQAFADPWTRRMYLTDLTQNNLATYLVLRSRRADLPPIMAYGGFWLLADDAHIATIASHPAWRGCGLGQWMLIGLLDAAFARGATRATLEVRAGNVAAQHLYQKLGFEITGLRKRYYRDGEDGLIMTTLPLATPEMSSHMEAARKEARARATRCLGDDSDALSSRDDAPGMTRVASPGG